VFSQAEGTTQLTETIILSAIGAAGLALAALGGLAYARLGDYRRALRRTRSLEPGLPSASPATDIPASRYQPMFRLLSGEDADFLRRKGRCPDIARQWERSQRRVVRLYLKELAGDFQILHRQARMLAAAAPEEFPYLLPLLFKQQFAFWRALIWIELRLSLGGAGLPRINPAALAGAFEAVRREISHAAASRQDQPA
jgi:hypothetical protein